MGTRSEPSASRRPSIGILAVQFGLITQKQLMECLDYQRGEGAEKDLEQILIDRGLITREAVDKLLQSYDESQRAQAPKPSADGLTSRQTRVANRPAAAEEGKPGTSVKRRPTTSIQRAPPASAKRQTTAVVRETAARVPSDADVERAHRRHMLLGVVLALLPLAALGAYLVFNALSPAPPERSGGGASATPTLEPTPDVPPTPPDPTERIGVVLKPLKGTSELVERWNRIADRVNACRDAEQYKPYLDELARLVTDARKTPYEADIRAGYKSLVGAMNRRGEQVFAFIQEESKRLADAGKFGDAIRAWDWFPGHLDPGGQWAKEIEKLRASTLETGRRHYQALRSRAEKLAGEKKHEQAKIVMLEALEIGLPEITDEAYQLVSKYTEAEDAVARAAEEAQLEEFTRKARAERETSQRAATVHGQFWELVAQRRFDKVPSYLQKQREGAPAEVVRQVGLLEKAFATLKSAFTHVETGLARQRGREVAVAFVDRSGQVAVQNLQLQSAERGEIVYVIEGKRFTASLYEVAPVELERAAAEHKDAEVQELLRGVAALLRDDFVAAHAALQRSRGEGASLLAFVESSSTFLERNAPEYRARAKRHMEAREWELAVQEYSRLVSIGSERKEALLGRARASFGAGNFVSTVLDIEQLFEMGECSAEAVDLLNKSWQRARLITKAIRIYEDARRKDPENGRILENLVLLYLAIHQYDNARAALAEAKRISGTVQLGYAIHLLNVASEPAFAGQVFKASFGQYDLESNVSQKYANEMARFMDHVYKEYERMFPPSKNKSLRFAVKIFASESEFFGYYRKVTGGSPSSPFGKILAYYMPMSKELVGWNADDVRETMQHEGLHQFIDYYVDDCPIWFNEGYASYFEKSTADEPRFNPERHMTARGLLVSRQLPKLRDLFLMDGGTFRSRGAWHYGSSWAAIYYLIKQGRKSLLDRYFEELMMGKSQRQAFDAVFAKIDLDELESRWRKAIFDEDYDKR